LAALEKRLGVRLLNRTTRRLSLTPEGERYLEDGDQILRDIENLERSLSESRDTPRGLLRINAGFGFGRRHLAPLISDFIKAWPDVEIILHLSDRPLDLTEHALDIGIRFGTPLTVASSPARLPPTAACSVPHPTIWRNRASRSNRVTSSPIVAS
jgi:DNA-binding transcriptional LysR family regulator